METEDTGAYVSFPMGLINMQVAVEKGRIQTSDTELILRVRQKIP